MIQTTNVFPLGGAGIKKVLITGCSGFLANHIAKACQLKGWLIKGVDKRPIPLNHNMNSPARAGRLGIEFVQADVFDLTYRDLLGIDYVIHLAWRTNIPDCVRHPEESTYQNIDMSLHLLEVAKEAGIKKFLFPSTASLYGHNPTPWKEDMPLSPIEPYSWQKLSIEYACKMYNTQGLPTAVLRFFQVYGEFQREDTALAKFLKCKVEGKPITLTRTDAQSSFSSGQRDFVYAGDVAEAVVLALEKGEGIYNVGTGVVHTMEEIANALNALVNWIPKRDYEVERHEADVTRLKALGWSPKENVINWLKKYA